MDLRLILWVASSVTPRAVLHSALLPPSWRVCPCSLPRPRATSKCAVSPSQAGFLALTAGLSQKLTTYDSFSCVGVRASSEGAPDGLPPRCLAGVSAHALRCGLRVGVVGVPLRVTGRCSSSQCLPCPEGSQGGGNHVGTYLATLYICHGPSSMRWASGLPVHSRATQACVGLSCHVVPACPTSPRLRPRGGSDTGIRALSAPRPPLGVHTASEPVTSRLHDI